jgi:hypothetical protein
LVFNFFLALHAQVFLISAVPDFRVNLFMLPVSCALDGGRNLSLLDFRGERISWSARRSLAFVASQLWILMQAAVFPEFFGSRPTISVSRSLFSSPVQHLAPMIVSLVLLFCCRLKFSTPGPFLVAAGLRAQEHSPCPPLASDFARAPGFVHRRRVCPNFCTQILFPPAQIPFCVPDKALPLLP